MKVLRFAGKAIKFLFVGILLLGHFIMNCIGVLVCAITDR